jgi:hypothetical protein
MQVGFMLDWSLVSTENCFGVKRLKTDARNSLVCSNSNRPDK